MSENIPKTELFYKKSKPIDQLNIEDAIYLMIEEQKKHVEKNIMRKMRKCKF